MTGGGLRRRELLHAAAAAVALGPLAAPGARAATIPTLDFAALPDGAGWPGWTCCGTATLDRRGGHGRLAAGTDVFPCDPRPVAFAVDQRFGDGTITATLTATGACAGAVLRRTAPDRWLAAVLDTEQLALRIVRRRPGALTELARVPVVLAAPPLRIAFTAAGPSLTARLSSGGRLVASATARDEDPVPGDPGVLATARTLFPSAGPPVLPALGNARLLPYGVQEGEAVLDTAVGQAVLDLIRERSTAVFTAIELDPREPVRPTAASVVAATTGPPVTRGARLRIAADVPARVTIELATDPEFRRSRRLRAGLTGDFDAAFATARDLPPGSRVYWRARLRRRRVETVGPTRSFRVLPPAGHPGAVRLAIGACASQFGPVFDVIAAQRPDVFVWQGDLNYPDTMGPLAQTVPAYAGIWREFLANPRLDPILARTAFAAQRDDHDYGVQDARAATLAPWGLAPWSALVERRDFYRFSAGLADVWVLDQRRHKSDPAAPDTPDKTLLGPGQRAWLVRTLAASRAPFKVICSPCTLAPVAANARDGSWAAGFTAERDLLLRHIADHVRGQTIFVTGDTHWTMAYERDGLFEVRPCPLSIPTPNDITLVTPQAAEDARRVPGVRYADDDRGHVAILDVRGDDATTRLDVRLLREDGAERFAARLTQPRDRQA